MPREYVDGREGDKFALGNLLRKYRMKKGLSQREVSQLLHIGAPATSQYENGIRLPPFGRDRELQRLLEIPKEEYDLAYEKSRSDLGKRGYTRREVHVPTGHRKIVEGYYALVMDRYLSADEEGQRKIRLGLEKLIEGVSD